LKILGDLNDTAEHEAKREKIKLDALIDTIKSDEVSTTQRGAAAEMLLEESVTDGLGSMQSKIVDCGGIGALIDMVKVRFFGNVVICCAFCFSRSVMANVCSIAAESETAQRW